jgi:uncharacterized protein YacL
VPDGVKGAPLTRTATKAVVQLTRVTLAIGGAVAGLSVRDVLSQSQTLDYPSGVIMVLFVVLGTSMGFIFGGILGRELQSGYDFLEQSVREMGLSDLVLGGAGLLVGLVFALILSVPIRALEPQILAFSGQVGIFIVLAYLGLRIAFVKRHDVKILFSRFTGGSDSAPREALRFLDTSAIIDGRFARLMDAGFIEGQVKVPGFVLSEMQTLADSADDVRRARGRRGLDLLLTLRGGENAVDAFTADYPELAEVDAKLVQLALDTGGSIVTVDHNLTQVARLRGINVMNVNDLAVALKPTHLPGEQLHVQVTRDGKEPEQGVAYLEDGTMVVVQNGRSLVGSSADVIVTSVLQTAGGRMIFARQSADS